MPEPGGMDNEVPPPPVPGPWEEKRRRNLRDAAKSIYHFLCHKEYNKWCDGCVRGKTRDALHFIGSFEREITHVGSVLTGDPTPMWDAAKCPGIGATHIHFPFKACSGTSSVVFTI